MDSLFVNLIRMTFNHIFSGEFFLLQQLKIQIGRTYHVKSLENDDFISTTQSEVAAHKFN